MATHHVDDAWEYRRKLLLAPMVRVNSLAFRTLCAEHGADMLYSEEIISQSLAQATRSENAALGTVDFTTPAERGSGRVILRVQPGERVVLQLGAACAADAVQAAQKAAMDVKAVDLNMGCPVKFSTQGGMGSALLSDPERVRDILTALRRNLPASVPVTAKIRLLESFDETLQLAKLIESCGVAALAVHARRRHDRPRHWAQWDQFKLLRSAMPSSLPLILNGDVFTPSDVPRALEATDADALMLARGALWNPSLFEVGRGRSMATQAEVVSRYVDLCEETENHVGNAKYVAMLMLEGGGKTDPFKMFQRAQSYADLRSAAAACKDHPHFCQPGGEFLPAVLEPPPDRPDAPTLEINSWRKVPSFWKPGVDSKHGGGGKSGGKYKAAKNRAAPVTVQASAPSAAADDGASNSGNGGGHAASDPSVGGTIEHPCIGGGAATGQSESRKRTIDAVVAEKAEAGTT